MKKLLSLCPRVEKATGGTVTALDDRSLNAVLSLGLFAVESKLQVWDQLNRTALEIKVSCLTP